MGWQENSLTVDDWGVRVGDEEFPLRAFAWDVVNWLRAYSIGEGREKFSVIEIHHGEDWEEVLSVWEDFPELADGVSTYLPDVRPDWLEVVQGLPAMAEPVTVWKRAG